MEPRLRSAFALLLIVIMTSISGVVLVLWLLILLIVKGPRKTFIPKDRSVRPAVLRNSEFGNHEFVRLKKSDITLHCVIKGPPHKPLMLFLHGLPELWYSWRYQMKEFSQSYRVVAVDLRGFGESDKPTRVSDYFIETVAGDIAELISTLNYQKCILVAHDWGGAIAWRFAQMRGDMIEKLIICNSPHPAAIIDTMMTSVTQFAMSCGVFAFQVPFLPYLCIRANDFAFLEEVFCGSRIGAKKGIFTEEDMEVYKYSFSKPRDWIGPMNYSAAALRYTDAIRREPKVDAPVLMIWGTKDGVMDKNMATISAPYAHQYTVIFVEGASHWVQQERPTEVNNYIREFLENNKSGNGVKSNGLVGHAVG